MDTTKKRSPIVYRRNYRGDWFRNGQWMRSRPPRRVVDMAANMAIECRIEIAR